MNVVAEVVVTALLLLGAGFVLIGSWGLVRLPLSVLIHKLTWLTAYCIFPDRFL